MADRIQLRRGTTTQWNTANPVLEEGEIGFNITLGQFKIGDGASDWSTLDYYPSGPSLETSLGSYIEISEKGAIDGVAELDGNRNVTTISSVVFEGTTDDNNEVTLQIAGDPVSDVVLTLPAATGTLALTSDVTAAINNLIGGSPATLDTLAELASAINNDPNFFDNIDALPSQTGNAGKYLTTNGTTASWAEASTPTPHPFALMG